ncbi:alcohol dehydrogenase family protein [Thalassotalea ponticola]|uniref:alcohol dehydrogenase family protein n=1 Tax=Thalassotalea ponticola TaxID=1523392 RepID=UPI0025B41D80|nr:alcohol dehydrogenase family protein [Thalassotalea ponticola]MDN3653840.1 alcohol dehydrogenase family protein [Thalassotalea ponticola]
MNLSYLQNSEPDRFELNNTHPSMKAVVTTGNGGYDKLQYADVPIPAPRANEVLIKVLAAGVNNTEINTRLGWYSSSVKNSTKDVSTVPKNSVVEDGGWNDKTPFPLIQGTDCCGQVVAYGEGAQSPDIGQRVLVRSCMRVSGFESLDNIWMASDFDGAFAQYVTVPASEVFAVRSDWTDAELATIPCSYGTAENMVHRAKVSAEDVVLVTGASGGVGSALIQLIKRRGARVIAVVGKEKCSAVQHLGADVVFTRGTNLLSELGESAVTVIIDNVAGADFEQQLKLLVRGGRYVSSGAIAGPIVTFDMRDFYLKDLTLIGCTVWDEPVFTNLISYIENQQIKPLLAKTYPLKDIELAQREFMQKKHVGNFVLIPPSAIDLES